MLRDYVLGCFLTSIWSFHWSFYLEAQIRFINFWSGKCLNVSLITDSAKILYLRRQLWSRIGISMSCARQVYIWCMSFRLWDNETLNVSWIRFCQGFLFSEKETFRKLWLTRLICQEHYSFSLPLYQQSRTLPIKKLFLNYLNLRAVCTSFVLWAVFEKRNFWKLANEKLLWSD